MATRRACLPPSYSVSMKQSTISAASPAPTTRAPKQMTFASLWQRVRRAENVSLTHAARIPLCLFAAMLMPMPVPQTRIPFSYFPSATPRAARSGTGFRNLEGNAESGDCFLVIAFYLVECFRVFPNVHRNPYSPICPISQSSCTLSTWATMTMPWANAAYSPRASRSITF